MKKKLIFVILLIFLITSASYALTGHNVSNYLKKLILPEIENATGYKFYAQKIVINVIPAAIELKAVKAYDDNGSLILQTDRIKAYISFSPLLNKELQIDRLAIRNLKGTLSKVGVQKLLNNIQHYLNTLSGYPLKVIIKSIILEDTDFSVVDNLSAMNLNRLNADIKIADTTIAHIVSGRFSYSDTKGRRFNSDLKAALSLKKDILTISNLHLLPNSSKAIMQGDIEISKHSGIITAEVDFLIKTIKEIFNLKGQNDGRIYASGDVRIKQWAKGLSDVSLDLKVKGSFYLEVLMDLLNVSERLKGYVTADGVIKGYLNDLYANGKAKIQNGDIFGVLIDSAVCDISYKDFRLSFKNGKASVYGGKADVDVWIALPVVNEYYFNVIVKDADSKGIFNLIGFDPLVSDGKINGKIMSEGNSFAPKGQFIYISNPTNYDVLKRINLVTGTFDMADNVLKFNDMMIHTPLSEAKARGIVDLNNDTLNFTATGKTSDLYELASPYFTAANAKAEFNAKVSGGFDNPIVNLEFFASDGLLKLKDIYPLKGIKDKFIEIKNTFGNVIYGKDILKIISLKAVSNDVKINIAGDVMFHTPKHIFDIANPVYKIKIDIEKDNLSDVLHISQLSSPIEAKAFISLNFDGKHDDVKISYSGDLKDLYYGDIKVADTVSMQGFYSDSKFYFNRMNLKKGFMHLTGLGTVSTDMEFDIHAEAKNIDILDLLPQKITKNLNKDYLRGSDISTFKMSAKGNPHFHNIELKALLLNRKNKNMPLNNAFVEATIKDTMLSYKVSLPDNRLIITGDCMLKDNYRWHANAILKPARYDSFVHFIVSEPPKDLLLNLNANIVASGDKDTFNADVDIERFFLSAFNNSFTNAKPIKLKIKNKAFFVDNIVLKNDASEFTVNGDAVIGMSINLTFEGKSNLDAIKLLVRQIEAVRGNASFIIVLRGDWAAPDVIGGVTVDDGALAIKNFPQRFSDIQGYLYLYDNKVVFERLNLKVASGDVSLKGISYLKGWHLKTFSLEAKLKSVVAHFSRNFWIETDGMLHFRGDIDKQFLFGDLSLKRARYAENIQWMQWLSKNRAVEKATAEVKAFDNIGLNISIKGDNILIDNNLAKANLNADLVLRGTAASPLLFGRVESKDGNVYFRNNNFKILKSTIDFANPLSINPYFDITAETTISGYKIKLILDGHLEQFNMALSSTPHLNDADIFALLTIGQLSNQTRGIDGGIGATEAASFITGKISDVIEERFKTIIGIDRIQVSPQISKQSGSIIPKISFEKRLGDKLYVTYSSVFDVIDEHIWKLEYALTDKLSLIGVRDEKSGIGADIKFRFEFQ